MKHNQSNYLSDIFVGFLINDFLILEKGDGLVVCIIN